MGFEFPDFNKLPEKQELRPNAYPHVEAAVEAYTREYKDKSENAEILRIVLNELIESEVENSHMFVSETGVELPYTSINTGELARRIYKKISGPEQPAEEKPSLPRKKKFIFGTSPAMEDGDQFTTVEYAMHECIKRLPAAIENLKSGRHQEEDEEIFTLGMPTNVLGKIPDNYAQKICENPADELGKIYAELIRSKIERDKTAPKTVELFGQSLGASFAVRAGENLKEQKVVTQDFISSKKIGLPYLRIRTDAPVAMGPSKIKQLQIPVGFLLDAAIEMFRPEVKKIIFNLKKFKEAIRERLTERGIKKRMSDDQASIKKRVMHSIIFALGKGLEPKPDTKITQVYGLRDITTITTEMLRESKLHKEKLRASSPEISLAENLLERKSDTVRRFGVNMAHLNPWFRANELKRMDKLAETVGKLIINE